MNDPALGGGFALEADVFEEASVPERIEVALDGSLIVNVARVREDVGENHVFRNTTISVNVDSSNDIGLHLRANRRN
jgi:hypothetical protein